MQSARDPSLGSVLVNMRDGFCLQGLGSQQPVLLQRGPAFHPVFQLTQPGQSLPLMLDKKTASWLVFPQVLLTSLPPLANRHTKHRRNIKETSADNMSSTTSPELAPTTHLFLPNCLCQIKSKRLDAASTGDAFPHQLWLCLPGETRVTTLGVRRASKPGRLWSPTESFGDQVIHK